ncbi:sugar transferase [Lactobacillus curvatus]|nr:sugar transferase [Latilactobacillus curvatus]MSE24064.1 sugar transferase [Latilactobacillus curvatus]
MEHQTLADITLYDMIKRLLDITSSMLALFVLSPLFIIVMMMIKMSEPQAPIFFSQVRLGKNKKPFKIYKFRTMRVGAEKQINSLLEKNEVEGAMFKMKNDPRVTKVGAFLRKTSIDEFPQLFNVLKGDMALVGPRPPLPREVAKYNSYELQRLTITPGCTGLWQVSGRNELDFKEMVELDLHYIQIRSLMTDIKIMIKTIFVIVGEKNGY